uniref:Exportin-2 n=1 Tax=Globodera rostochiensis TaxID=31243 RepID=A0A914GU25_GLORO
MGEQNSTDQLIRLLEATLIPESVKGAEDELLKLTAFPGFARAVLRIACNDSFPGHIRNAASVSLKNFVRSNWSGDGDAPLAEDEREQIRSALLETMFQLPSYVRPQMIEIVCQISKVDFPDRWPQLIQLLSQHLQAATAFDQLSVSLGTLEQLISRYRHEMRSNKLWTEIILVVNTVAEPLTQLYSRMLQYLPDPSNRNTQLELTDRLSWLQIVLELTRIYHSLISQDLPAYFEDNLTPWMEGFLQLLELKLPDLEAKSVDLEPNEHDKLRCEICEIATLFSQRFEDCFMTYTERFIASVWNLLVMTDSRIRFDSMVSAALSFLAAICQRPHYAPQFRNEGVLKAICENVVVKNLMLRPEDLEIYENEPFEFLKRDVEGSDLETRRRGAADFVRALCKQFEPEVCALLSSAIQSFLTQYHQNPALNFAKKDVVYYLVSALASKSTTTRHGTTDASQLINVAEFYQEHGRCVEVFDCSIIRFLSSSHVLLHHYVAYAVERLFLMKHPTIPQDNLFNSANIPIDVLALMRTFSLMDDRMAANAHLYVNKFFQMVTEAVRVPKNPLFVHYIFESLCILIRKAYSKVVGGLDQHVIPIIELILGNDVLEFVPYVLQIIALMLDQSQMEKQRGIELSQETYVRFFPTLLRPDYWSRSANVPALVLVFESFIRCFPQLTFGAQYSGQVLGIFQRLIGSKAYDQHGFRLANSFISHLDSSGYERPLTSNVILLTMLNRMQQNKTSKYTRQFTLFILRYAACKGGTALANSLETIQAGIYGMVLDKILLTEMHAMPQTTTYEEKRIVTIGAAKLITDTTTFLGQRYAQIVELVVNVLEAFEHKTPTAVDAVPEKEEPAEVNELEYSDPYCKLSYAQHPEPFAPEIGNIKKHFAQAVLVTVHATNPENINCLNARVQNCLRAYSSAI